MKQVVYGLIVGLIAVLGIGIVVTINGKATRGGEIDRALSVAVENAVETTMNEKTYAIENNQEFIADFTQNLLAQISNDSDIEIQVAKVDSEKGILGVKVIETYTHPNGKKGKSECETTAVFEQVPTKATLCKVTYKLEDGLLYKEYQIRKGDEKIVPKVPQKEGKTFKGWKNASGNIEKISGKVTEDATYVATWN